MLSSPWRCCVQERPQLEKERSELLSSIASDIQFLRDLEDKTLELLQKSDGEDVKLPRHLSDCKVIRYFHHPILQLLDFITFDYDTSYSLLKCHLVLIIPNLLDIWFSARLLFPLQTYWKYQSFTKHHWLPRSLMSYSITRSQWVNSRLLNTLEVPQPWTKPSIFCYLYQVTSWMTRTW